jgi:hypothetical protein
MFKKYLSFSLLLLAVCGFFIISLQYKVTELSLDVPYLEETYHQKKQQISKLELDLRLLKNPKTLFEYQSSQKHMALVFPKSQDVLALNIDKLSPLVEAVPTKNTSLNLPLAKVFP